MKKRIYFSFTGLIIICILSLSTALSCIFYNVTKKQETSAIKDRTILISDLLNRGINEDYINDEYYKKMIFKDFISNENETARLTIIAPDGTVLLDNKTYASSLENHKNREEVIQASEHGTGEAMRYSDTIGKTTYYYAKKLDDGNILRVSKPMNNIIGIFTEVLPVVIGIAVLFLVSAQFIIGKLTQSIVKPLNDINFDSDNMNIYDELSIFIKKIDSQKKEISAQIQAAEARTDTLKAIMNNMKEGLILTNNEGIILSANKSIIEILGENDITNKSLPEVCRDIELIKKMKLCLNGESSETHFYRNNKNYVIFLNPVYNAGKINGMVILFLDITEKYLSEKQRKEFSANVSHELKTPLTTILAISDMISSEMVKDEDIKDFNSKISIQARRLLALIEDIIKLSEFDENDFNSELTCFDLYELAVSAAEILKDKAEEKNISIEVTGEHINLTANMRMLDELLFNLIDNAVKYNNEFGKVLISISEVKEYIKISVADTGIGIPEIHHERIFERFYRVDKSRSQKTGGTGLGLSIVKHIVEYHKGKIEINSLENEGTTITCMIKKMLNS